MRYISGPWIVNGVLISSLKNTPIARVIVCSESDANAHLISASPELLTLAEYALDNLIDDDPHVKQMFISVIKKARGE